VLSPLADLGVSLPVLAAPMAGGPTTPDLVVAAARVGSLGFLAAGYRTADALAQQVRTVRAETDAFGVNLFAPNPVPVDRAAYDRYRQRLRPLAERFGVDLHVDPVEDDDHWQDKVDVLVTEPVPIVSFTFGIPPRGALDALRAAGSSLLQTVTNADEAAQAAETGIDVLVLQGRDAGGHSGTFTPSVLPAERPLTELVAAVRERVDLPIIAAGGLDTAERVEEVLRAGAGAVAVGTALLLTPEAGTSAPHREAIAGPDRGATLLTRAFSGRPARACRNEFVDVYDEGAPSGYPAVHHLTSPIRRAAAAAGDPEHINLWAGSNHRTTRARPAGEILVDLSPAP
jgi:NAD(P)H-dependent flavin oxidoreductase YrpB (nitropropane dioxygenase family)